MLAIVRYVDLPPRYVFTRDLDSLRQRLAWYSQHPAVTSVTLTEATFQAWYRRMRQERELRRSLPREVVRCIPCTFAIPYNQSF